MSVALLESDEMIETIGAPLLSAGPAAAGQEAAWETFCALPMPTRTDELWRFANVKDLDLSGYTQPHVVDEGTRDLVLERSCGVEAVAGRMVFANDQLLSRDVVSDSLEQLGVIWLPLEQAMTEHADLVQQYFMREEAILGGQKFAALHASQVRTGTFLHVPRGVEINLPIEAFHWLHGRNGSCFPHTLIVAEERSKVTFVDYYQSTEAEAAGFACAVNDLWLGAGAQVTYVSAQTWSRQTLALQINATVVGRDAYAKMLFAQLGGRHVRSESVSHLRAPGGRSDMLAVTVADESQEIDARTFQVHEAPNTASDLLYKNSLDDKARTIFAGLIRVDPGAHRTDAFQKIRNLLLSDNAEANSAPGLEIEANDVRCTHGATTGQIEQEELFYLLSRGIPLNSARRLIVEGYLQEALDRLESPRVGEFLRKLIKKKFDRPSRAAA